MLVFGNYIIPFLMNIDFALFLHTDFLQPRYKHLFHSGVFNFIGKNGEAYFFVKKLAFKEALW